jgi:hypothetical protein
MNGRTIAKRGAWVVFGLIGMLAGCNTPAQIFWSPDGRRAVYYAGKAGDHQAILIDERGQQLMALGTSAGGFAWSADSTALYFAHRGRGGDAPRWTVDRSWVEDGSTASTAPATAEGNDTAKSASAPASTAPSDGDAGEGDADAAVISVLRDGRITPLAMLPSGRSVVYMILSPDQQWLAMLVYRPGVDDEPGMEVYAHRLGSDRLHLVVEGAEQTLCFSGPCRLVYVRGEHGLGRRAFNGRDDPVRPADAVDRRGRRGPAVHLDRDDVPGSSCA